MIFEAKNSIFVMQNSDPDSAKHGTANFFFQTGFGVAFLHKKVEFLASNNII